MLEQGDAGGSRSYLAIHFYTFLNGAQIFVETSHSDLGLHVRQRKDGNLYSLGFNQSNINGNKLQSKKLSAVVRAKLLSPA